jgi:hypothetical protein
LGNLLFQVVRSSDKQFRQRQPREGGGWQWSVKGVRQVPYRLLELGTSRRDATVFIVEGEKDADRLAGLGLVATCNAGGAGKWTAGHAWYLAGRRVAILPDHDQPGRRHAEQVAASLFGLAARVKLVELPGLPPKGDVSDWLDGGGTVEQLLRLVEEAPEWAAGGDLGDIKDTFRGSENQNEASWPELLPFEELELPPFPTSALPKVLRDWVTATSRFTQTPADLAGLLALAACSAGIARRVEVEPRPGWREPVNLFVVVLLDPANRKSAVFHDALAPLRELEAEWIEAARPEIARRQSERRRAERRLAKLEKLSGEKGDARAHREADQLAEQLARWDEPALPRLLVDDATSEKLGILLAQQGGRVASMSPEGGVFDLMAGLYSKSGLPQFGVYLMGHAGDDLITDRVGRESLRVARPALTCAYALQSQVIRGLAAKAVFRGRGLLARFLYALPHSWIGRRQIVPPPVPEAVRAAYHDVVRGLFEGGKREEERGGGGEWEKDDANLSPSPAHPLPPAPPRLLTLDARAAGRFGVWQAEVEAMLADGGAMETFRDWGGKLAGATLRLAAVLHCVAEVESREPRVESRQLSEETLEAAITIARYLIPHAEAALRLMRACEDPAWDDARYLLRWIERQGAGRFTKNEARQHGKRRFSRPDDLDAPLAELVRRGYLRPLPSPPQTEAGRPPSPAYAVNPAVFENETAEKCPLYPLNPIDSPARGNEEVGRLST